MEAKSSLVVDCPNVDELSLEEILKVATSNERVASAELRYKLLDLMYRCIFKFDLEKDLILAILDASDKKLILAPAGAGKTTTVFGIGLILEKLCRKSRLRSSTIDGKQVPKKLDGDNVLCLVYNRHNVLDIKKRHSQLVSQVKLSGLGGLQDLNDNLCVSTMHSFCRKWLNDYKMACRINGFNLVESDEEQSNLMFTAISKVLAKLNAGVNPKDVKMKDLMLLYGFQRESLLDYNDIMYNDIFIDLALPVEVIKKTFETYDAVKRTKRKYDFTDQLLIFDQLISGYFDIEGEPKESEGLLERLKMCYEYIATDEVQDFTPLMNKILKKIAVGQTLVCIGDDDQSLYGFKGADPYSILKFKDRFPDSKVFLLKTNRRCPENIVNLSKFVIEGNELRFNKDIKSNKPTGSIEYKPFNDRRGQIISVIDEIKRMGDSDRQSTCICYRNSSSSADVTISLMESRIPFHILSGISPFDYGLFTTVLEVLRDLNTGTNKKLHLKLYKCLPISKNELNIALGYDASKKRFKESSFLLHLSKIDFGAKMQNQSFVQNLTWLLALSKNMENVSLKDYFPRLLKMIKTYYWDYLVEVTNKDKETDELFTKSILKYFSVDKTFSARFVEYEKDVNVLKSNDLKQKGVCVSTFHSLKGLEKDNVFIIDLKESTFPNTASIELSPYPEEVKQLKREGERRLFYVAVTRAKKRLTFYYDKVDPSVYITDLLFTYKLVESKKTVVESLSLNCDEKEKVDEYDFKIAPSSKFNKTEVVLSETPKATPTKKEVSKTEYRQSLVDTFFQ